MRKTTGWVLPAAVVFAALLSVPADGAIPLAWTRVYDGGAGDDHPAGAAADPAGGLVAAVNSGGGIRVFRFGSDNTLSWTATLDNASIALTNTLLFLNPVVAPDGSVYVAGRFSLPAGGMDLLVAKFAPTGAPAWSRTYDVGSSGGDETPYTLHFGGGNLILAGNIDIGPDTTIFAVKISGGDGSVLWEKIYPGIGAGNPYQIAELVSSNSIALAGSGDLVAAALFTKDPPDPVNGDSDDIRLIRFSGATGDNVVETTYDSGGDEKPWGVGLDNAGTAYVAGRQRSAGSDYRFLLLKVSPAGAVDNVATRGYPVQAVAKFLSFEGTDNVVIVGDSDNGIDSDVSRVRYRMSDLSELESGDHDSGGNDSVRGVAIDAQGDLLVLINENNDNVVLLKAVSGGLFSREMTYSGTGVSGKGIVSAGPMVYLTLLQFNGADNDMVAVAGGTPPPQASPQAGGSGGCFIATAAWGSPMSREVGVFRRFRDRMLLKSGLGTRLVQGYCRLSPPVAERIAENPLHRAAARFFLVPALLAAWMLLQPVPVQLAALFGALFLLVPLARKSCNIKEVQG